MRKEINKRYNSSYFNSYKNLGLNSGDLSFIDYNYASKPDADEDIENYTKDSVVLPPRKIND